MPLLSAMLEDEVDRRQQLADDNSVSSGSTRMLFGDQPAAAYTPETDRSTTPFTRMDDDQLGPQMHIGSPSHLHLASATSFSAYLTAPPSVAGSPGGLDGETEFAPFDDPVDASHGYRQPVLPSDVEDSAPGSLHLPLVLPPPSQSLLASRHAQRQLYRPSASTSLAATKTFSESSPYAHSQQQTIYAPQYRPSSPSSWSQAAYGPDEMSWHAQRPPSAAPPPLPPSYPSAEGGPYRTSWTAQHPRSHYSPYPASSSSSYRPHQTIYQPHSHQHPYPHHHATSHPHLPQSDRFHHPHQAVYHAPPPPLSHGPSLVPHPAYSRQSRILPSGSHPHFRRSRSSSYTTTASVQNAYERSDAEPTKNREPAPDHDAGQSYGSAPGDEGTIESSNSENGQAGPDDDAGGGDLTDDRSRWTIPPIESLLPERHFAQGGPGLSTTLSLALPRPATAEDGKDKVGLAPLKFRRRGRDGEWGFEPAVETPIVQLGPRERRRQPPKTQVRNACVNCQRLHKPCDDARPCTRCLQKGTEETCVDSSRKPKRERKAPAPRKRKSKAKNKKQAAAADDVTEPAQVDGSRDGTTITHDQPPVDPLAPPGATLPLQPMAQPFDRRYAEPYPAEFNVFYNPPPTRFASASTTLSAFQAGPPPASYSSYQPHSPTEHESVAASTPPSSAEPSASYEDGSDDSQYERDAAQTAPSTAHWYRPSLPPAPSAMARYPAPPPTSSFDRPSHALSMSAAPQHYRLADHAGEPGL